MPKLADFVRHLRPAPLGSAVAQICGLSRRKVIRTAHGQFLVNPLSNLGYQLVNGKYEPGMTAVLVQYLKREAVFIDLGANEGYFSVVASGLVGPAGTVIAVEPQSRLQDPIAANLKLNDCHNVRVLKAAISSATKRVQLQLAPDLNTGASSLFRPTKYLARTEEVQSFTLAGFLDEVQVGSCDLMKVDIEGSEYDVFFDAGDILRSGIIKNIALEIHNSILAQRGLSGDRLHQRILSYGYKLNDTCGNWVYTFQASS
jgi:FkbM family methyltransferase